MTAPRLIAELSDEDCGNLVLTKSLLGGYHTVYEFSINGRTSHLFRSQLELLYRLIGEELGEPRMGEPRTEAP